MSVSRPLSAAEQQSEAFRKALVEEGAALMSDDYLFRKQMQLAATETRQRAGKNRARTLKQLEKLKQRVTGSLS